MEDRLSGRDWPTTWNNQTQQANLTNTGAAGPHQLLQDDRDLSYKQTLIVLPTWDTNDTSGEQQNVVDLRSGESPQMQGTNTSGPYPKKREPRATQACDACRTAKSKCDENPRCANCVQKNIQCKRDPLPTQTKGTSTQADIINRLDQIMESQEAIQNALKRSLPSFEEKLGLGRHKNNDSKDTQHDESSTSYSHGSSPKNHQSVESTRCSPPASGSKSAAMSPDHTTGWVRVLEWPAIASIVGDAGNLDGLRSNPIKQESERALLLPVLQRPMPRSPSQDDRISFSRGQIEQNVYGSPVNNSRIYGNSDTWDHTTHRSRFTSLSETRINQLTATYLTKIGIMHPIVQPDHLWSLVANMVTILPEIKDLFDGSGTAEMIFAGTCSKKRRRTSSNAAHDKMSSGSFDSPWNASHTINTAIVLLALALGENCLRKGDEAANFDSDIGTPTSLGGNVTRSPNHFSPVAIYTEPSPQNHAPSSRASGPYDYLSPAVHEDERLHHTVNLSNEDNTPGLTFFAAATQLIGIQTGGNTFQHVQANILAGLYCGQLSRILESHAYYSNASRALYMILNPMRAHLQTVAAKREPFTTEENHFVILFWTCLQLESDILAELDVPQSPMLAWESTMPWPDLGMAVKMGLEIRHMECYNALLWLRRRLNHIHTNLYGPGIQDGYSLQSMNHLRKLPFIESLRESLEGCNLIAPSWTWDFNDTPARDILGARLRAKYYGGLVIVHRPFLRMVLNNGLGDKPTVEAISPLIMGYAGKCVEVLVKSTQAFQNVDGGRPIVTNPWGTAYAQWGNMMVLLAVYQNQVLRQFVNLDLLRNLARKTLGFLAAVAGSSAALWNIHRILGFTSANVLDS